MDARLASSLLPWRNDTPCHRLCSGDLFVYLMLCYLISPTAQQKRLFSQHPLETYRKLVIAVHNRAYRPAQPSGSTGIEWVALLSSALCEPRNLQLSAISFPPVIHSTWRGIEDRRASISSAPPPFRDIVLPSSLSPQMVPSSHRLMRV